MAIDPSTATASDVSCVAFNNARRRRYAVAIFLLLALIALVFWLSTPLVLTKDGMTVNIRRVGEPRMLKFIIRDSHGRPIPGVEAFSVSHSGGEVSVFTDKYGDATTFHEESEILSVVIDKVVFELASSDSLLEEIWATWFPIIRYSGLEFSVVVTKDRGK